MGSQGAFSEKFTVRTAGSLNCHTFCCESNYLLESGEFCDMAQIERKRNIHVRYGCQPNAYARKDIPLLKLIVHHSPTLLAFVCGLHLRLTKPQWQHVLRMADALIVSETRHKTIAGLYRLIVDAPDPSNGADSLRISPWTAEDLRAPSATLRWRTWWPTPPKPTSGRSM